MPDPTPEAVEHAEVVLGCAELEATLAFFTERLGFRLDAIFPADDPRVASLSGHGLRLRLERGTGAPPGELRLACGGARAAGELTAPNGTRVRLAPADPPLVVPALEPAFVLTRDGADAAWVAGRAGMRYRDLVPGRLGGRLVASHVRIPTGGPVPDYVHHHRVRFQLVFCCAGWVRVVYQGQGEPFVLRAGDAVLQPPGIRHRVLEASDGLEVVELSSPAEHETRVDHALELPDGRRTDGTTWAGQRFVRHVAARSRWTPATAAGFEQRDLGLADASGGLLGARVLRPADGPARELASRAPELASHAGELRFGFVLAGGVALLWTEAGVRRRDGLERGAAFVLPAGLPAGLADPTGDLELLEVDVPAADRSRASRP